MAGLQLMNPKETLKKARTVAVIGCSANPYRTSNYAANYLKEKGYRIIPVNPTEREILGEKCYASISDIPIDIPVDVMNIFRNKRYTAGVIKELSAWNKKSGQNPVFWTQLDVSSAEAEVIAEKNNIPYVRNVCIMVELDRLR
jgi:hypothetical protein